MGIGEVFDMLNFVNKSWSHFASLNIFMKAQYFDYVNDKAKWTFVSCYSK
jgi:hypothetical protein